jgi:L-phenylalanine/L-methionine N-acetyltransferase
MATAMKETIGWKALTFRPRQEEDSAGLFALFNEDSFIPNASLREPFASVEEMLGWLNGISAAHRFEIVALLDGAVVGFAGLYVLGETQAHMGWLTLGVRDAYQHRGIGSILMRMMVATAEIFVGLMRLQLTVFTDNPAAIALYEKFGFEIEGRHPRFGRRGEAFVDAYTMARLFDGAETATIATLESHRFQRAIWSSADGGRWMPAKA